MPWLLFFRIILSTVAEDKEVAKILEKVSKGSKLLTSAINNPASFLAKITKAKILGKGVKQSELTALQSGLQTLANTTKIKKRIMAHIKSTNISKIQHLQNKYLSIKGIFQTGKEAIINKINENDFDDIIGVFVNLSSSALLGGLWIPIIQAQSSSYGICSLTYISNPSKSYDYFNVSLDTWNDMVNATGFYGSGANSIFIRQYLGGIGKTRKEMKSDVRTNISRLNRASTNKTGTTIGIVNKELITQGYEKYGRYGIKSKKSNTKTSNTK